MIHGAYGFGCTHFFNFKETEMQLNECKSCGGTLERRGNAYVCKYCGNKWIIDADQDVHVIDRANAWSALRDGDFEKSAELFENIIFKAENLVIF